VVMNLEINFGMSEFDIPNNSIIFGTARSIKEISTYSIPSDCEVWIRKSGYPTTEEVSEISASIRSSNKNFHSVVGIGGGSTIDLSKVISTFISENEGICRLLMIPTNIGSGAEITNFATIWDFNSGQKLSKIVPDKIHRSVFYNFGYFLEVHRTDALIGALDALAHAYDSFYSGQADSNTRQMAREAIIELNDLLSTGFEFWPNELLISKFHNATILAAFCINKTKTSLSHGLSYGLTLHLGIPHGIAVGLVLREYLTAFAPSLAEEMSQAILEDSLRNLDFVLTKILKEKYSKIAVDKIEEAIDWGRVNNFLPIVTKEECLILLRSALNRIAQD